MSSASHAENALWRKRLIATVESKLRSIAASMLMTFVASFTLVSSAFGQLLPPPGVQVPTQEILRDTRPVERPTLAPSLQGPPVRAQNVPDETPVQVVDASVMGSNTLALELLRPLTSGIAGRAVTPGEIEDVRVALLTRYREAGYPFIGVTVSRLSVPGGFKIEFVVQEGRIAQVRLDRDVGPVGALILRFLNQAVTTGATSRARLERALLLAGDIPGVSVRGVLRPLAGGNAGELELVALVSRTAVSGLLTADNRGFRLVGPVQFLLVAQANSFTSFGERTEAALFATAMGESVFGQATSEFFVGGTGLRVRLYAGAGQTNPRGSLGAIGYGAFTQTAGLGLSYPLIRSRSANLTLGAQFDAYDSDISTGTGPSITAVARDRVRAVRLGLDGQYLDNFLPLVGSATNNATLRIHRGVDVFGASRASGDINPSRQNSDFRFTKFTGELQRTQALFAIGENMQVSLQATVAGQWSRDVLPASEKYFLGGNRLGRGFYVGEVSGDSAIAFSAEARLDVGLPALILRPDQANPVDLRPAAQFYGFYDAGRSFENLPTDTNRRIESWGGGVRFNFNSAIFLDIEGVNRITRNVDAGGAAVRPLPATAGYFRLMTRF
ncbi:ShlB/FhaC/HecB family hemolysin secretion/activation protein [Roseococcus sp.]|uniref:ShlB/FhaC/HecB family hemolysin secretion/activation protein n=1 Tax=Roseococcus sp. TaxID=2109646 RepID=UPI003BAB4096